MPEGHNSKYSDLSSDYHKFSYYSFVSIVLVFGAVIAGLAILNETQLPKWNMDRILQATTALIALSVIALGLYKHALELRPTDSEISAVKAYEAHRALNNYIDLKKAVHKRAAKTKIKDLVIEMKGWLGTRTPEFMSNSVTNLIANLERKAIPIIDDGNFAHIEQMAIPLYDLARSLERSSSKDFNEVVESFERLQPIENETVIAADHSNAQQIEASASKSILQRHSYAKSILVAIPVGTAVYLVAFFLQQAPPYVAFASSVAATGAAAAFVDRRLTK